ncbi:mitochondrial inner membrane translocase subunit [Penicillium waksmanii]|uniref:mitochondrial inner membrane translocase subunit n=1 Tax=Penicillium waksmanii TaxID=69791 RepID=UPI0025469C6A|nr:mitochondrial inner membrane translocase subunit [Penicillium waksmanii]KAJ5984016.1 mitochondrial inner membrane translocase subunit [Penicillium waksmanii]
MDHSRDPCPWVALSDFGGAFCMGAIGGAVWHGVKGFRNSPYGERRIGALTAIKARAPVLGGNFGVWGGLFSTYDCAIKGIRKKEDPWNAIIAGFFTGGSLAVRGGVKAARNSAIMCAVFLAVIEGVGIGFQRMMADNTKLEVEYHLTLSPFPTHASPAKFAIRVMANSPATFKPALILHGGAGVYQRSKLPPELYNAYHASLQSYLRSTHELLKDGASALDAVVHAVSLMEDDELFNCGRGSVFTTAGTIEMEASVMVTSVLR